MEFFKKNFWEDVWSDFIHETSPWHWDVIIIMAIPIVCAIGTIISMAVYLFFGWILGKNGSIETRGVDTVLCIALAVEIVGLLLLAPKLVKIILENLKKEVK